MNSRSRRFIDEFKFTASRSSGAGGQNVNKVNTKVELRFCLNSSKYLSFQEKELVARKLANKINDAGEIVLVSQQQRTQFKNKEAAIERFFKLIEQALKPERKRYKTKPTKASKERRLQSKQKQAVKKINRRLVEE